jgi:T4 superinfection immunity protein
MHTAAVSTKLQLLVVLLIAAITAKGETVRLEDERLTFTLPPAWVAIPQREVAQRKAEVQQSLAKPYTLNFKYGYQKQAADWFSYPYILIKQPAAERIPESKLRELPTIDLSPAENKMRELAPRLLQNLSIGKFSYDPITQKIWSESKVTLADGTEVRGLAMMEPTEKGVTAFYFYATADQYAELRPVFLQTALSVTPDPEIAYRSHAEDIIAGLHPARYFWLIILCWLLPGIIANKRNHPKQIPIWYLTVFLGWTGIGWIPAMIWACRRIPEPKPPTDLEPLKLDDEQMETE